MAGKKKPKPTGKAKHPSKPRKVKGGTRILGSKEKQRILKAPSDWQTILNDTILKWTDYPGILKIAGLTAGNLRSLRGKAERAKRQEDAVNLEAKKKADARLTIISSIWKKLLYAKKMIEGMESVRPQLLEIFKVLVNSLKRAPEPADHPEDEEPKK